MSLPACANIFGVEETPRGTRLAIYVYWSENANIGNPHRYTVEAKSYNHVILFPIFWITYFIANARGVYKEALTHFLAHSL